ncbi:hypothetical protein EET67_09795 [Pseudaminobacter arsenicus]|uniref:Uncharacterized protein n=1 Tax=Borborobacter arsenicus TaxID=1851146 RepID=A0A432V6Z3_9HYPH|nr:hypothetical protein [Pseudaminobacter arsenicus]RUM97900.1 hypothetical protein EET67_09795 [Pseudaminobacter arsenicus]
MKASDIGRAQKLASELAQNITMRDRLAAGDTLTLAIGQGGNQAVIVLSTNYLASIRADLVAAFDKRIADDRAGLAELGVEP